ncbi:MAG: DUF1080 domain-containing protein [Candidatus Hydrogenedentes bacterium]|nr:DUF1080 domain-containing protein [Candidatus Hydrogenedentota bacterium]
MKKLTLVVVAVAVALLSLYSWAAPAPPGEGWVSLFNGKDFTGWKVPDAAKDCWSIVDGTIDCDPKTGREGDTAVWSEQELGDIELYCEWKIKRTEGIYNVPTVLPSGLDATDASGKKIVTPMPGADSGIYLRGASKAQVNIWCWPIGSGEVYGYRMDEKMPPEVRAGVTPKKKADKPVGEWNTFLITMKGDRLTVVLNGETVIDKAQLPGVPEKGPIALQMHGGYDEAKKEWNGASSLVQFRNIYYRAAK